MNSNTKTRVLTAGVLAAAALTFGAAAQAAPHSIGYMNDLALDTAIETHGVFYSGHHLNIDAAYCNPEVYRGVRKPAGGGLTEYHGFKCALDAANGDSYMVYSLKVTGNGRYSYSRPVDAGLTSAIGG
jgi:hypothetical protein